MTSENKNPDEPHGKSNETPKSGEANSSESVPGHAPVEPGFDAGTSGSGSYGQQYSENAYGNDRYGQGQHGQEQHGHEQHGQEQHSQGQYGQGQQNPSQYGQGQNQGQYNQGQNQGQYNQGQNNQGQYNQQYPQGAYGQGHYQQPYGQQQYGQQPYSQPYGQGYAAYQMEPRPLSLTSLVLGIVGVVTGGTLLIPQILAVIFGHIGLKKERSGRSFALAGLIMGYIMIALGILFIVFIIIAFNMAMQYQYNVPSGGYSRL